MDRKIEYLPLDGDDDLFPEKPVFLQHGPDRRRRTRLGFDDSGRITDSAIWLCHGVLFSVSVTLFALSLALRYGVSFDVAHARHFAPYSPAAPAVEYDTARYSVGSTVDTSEYVGYGPHVDSAWRRITSDVGDAVISRAELDLLGLDPQSVTAADPRTGEQGYRAGLQVFHQLECVNLLRQDSFRDYYAHQNKDFEAPRKELRRRLDHCLEVIRMSVMCQSDVGVFTYKHYEGIHGQWPDLNTLHTCRKFDAIRDWASENSISR
jgi:hypothetical protein